MPRIKSNKRFNNIRFNPCSSNEDGNLSSHESQTAEMAEKNLADDNIERMNAREKVHKEMVRRLQQDWEAAREKEVWKSLVPSENTRDIPLAKIGTSMKEVGYIVVQGSHMAFQYRDKLPYQPYAIKGGRVDMFKFTDSNIFDDLICIKEFKSSEDKEYCLFYGSKALDENSLPGELKEMLGIHDAAKKQKAV